MTGLSGLELLRAFRDGPIPPPPMAVLMGMAATDTDAGRVVFECHPDDSTYNTLDVVHGGLVCTLAGTVVGCAVHTTLGAGVSYTSIDINVSYVRPVTVDSGPLHASGIVVKPERGRPRQLMGGVR